MSSIRDSRILIKEESKWTDSKKLDFETKVNQTFDDIKNSIVRDMVKLIMCIKFSQYDSISVNLNQKYEFGCTLEEQIAFIEYFTKYGGIAIQPCLVCMGNEKKRMMYTAKSGGLSITINKDYPISLYPFKINNILYQMSFDPEDANMGNVVIFFWKITINGKTHSVNIHSCKV